MLTTSSDKLTENLVMLRLQAMTSLTLYRHLGRAYSHDVVDLGFNYRMDEKSVALGTTQLRQLTACNDRRCQLVLFYRNLLAGIHGVIVPFAEADLEEAACRSIPILLESGADRSWPMRKLRSARIRSSLHYPAIHQSSYYRISKIGK